MTVDLLHGVFVSQYTRRVVDRLPVLIVLPNRLDVVALPLRVGAESLGVIHGVESILQHSWRRCTDERIRTPAHRDSPVNDGAVRVRLWYLGKCIEILRIP